VGRARVAMIGLHRGDHHPSVVHAGAYRPDSRG
jgi:hypothetical protein